MFSMIANPMNGHIYKTMNEKAMLVWILSTGVEAKAGIVTVRSVGVVSS